MAFCVEIETEVDVETAKRAIRRDQQEADQVDHSNDDSDEEEDD